MQDLRVLIGWVCLAATAGCGGFDQASTIGELGLVVAGDAAATQDRNVSPDKSDGLRFSASAGYLLIPSFNNIVKRYDAATGAFVDTFVPRRSGGLNQPWAAVFSPHDDNLYVSSGHFGGQGLLKAVLRYDGVTGAFMDPFVPQGRIIRTHAVTFGPDGNLYVGDRVSEGQGLIARFDGLTGAYIDDFVPPGSGGLGNPVAHAFGPSGRNPNQFDLYVSNEPTGNVLRFDGTTGDFLGVFVEFGSGGLGTPFGVIFGPDDNLYVADSALFGGVPAVLRFQGPSGRAPGAFIDAFVPPGSGGLLMPLGLLFGPEGNGDGEQDLYVNSQEINPNSFTTQPDTSSVKRYDGVSGAFIDTFIPIGSGGLEGPNIMTFTETDPVTLAYTGGN